MEELVFTPAALLSVLSQIDELKDVDVGVVETLDGMLQLNVGSSTYEIVPNGDIDIPVAAEVVEEVGAVSSEAYTELADSGTVDITTPVEAGIIKELAKTLLVGGLVRLTSKILK